MLLYFMAVLYPTNHSYAVNSNMTKQGCGSCELQMASGRSFTEVYVARARMCVCGIRAQKTRPIYFYARPYFADCRSSAYLAASSHLRVPASRRGGDYRRICIFSRDCIYADYMFLARTRGGFSGRAVKSAADQRAAFKNQTHRTGRGENMALILLFEKKKKKLDKLKKIEPNKQLPSKIK